MLRAAGLSPATRARALVAYPRAARLRGRRRRMPSDPTEDVERPSIPKSVPKALSEEEIALVLGAASGSDPRAIRDHAMLELLYASGLRISELVGLSISDLDLDDRLLRAFGKGSKERLVPFGRPAAAAIGEWLGRGGEAASRPGAVSARADDAEALFLSLRGRRMTRQGAWTVVRRGGGGGRPRGARHATRISPQLRHASPRSRCGRPRRPGALGACLDHDDADLHQGLPGAPAPCVSRRAPASSGQTGAGR